MKETANATVSVRFQQSEAIGERVPLGPSGCGAAQQIHPLCHEAGTPPPRTCVPVFRHLDLFGAARVVLDDPSVLAFPFYPRSGFDCGPGGLHPTRNGYGPRFGAPYGRAVFVDVRSGHSEPIDGREECRSASHSFRPGGWVPPDLEHAAALWEPPE